MGYNVKPADLLLVHGTDFVSESIEYVTKSSYSHVGGFVSPRLLLEANGFKRTGYQFPGAYKGCSDVFTCDSLTDDQRQKMIAHLQTYIGRRYSYSLIVWELLRYLGLTLTPGTSWDPVICSTLWAVEGYRNVGVDLCPGIPYPTPGDVANSKLLRKVGPF